MSVSRFEPVVGAFYTGQTLACHDSRVKPLVISYAIERQGILLPEASGHGLVIVRSRRTCNNEG